MYLYILGGGDPLSTAPHPKTPTRLRHQTVSQGGAGLMGALGTLLLGVAIASTARSQGPGPMGAT